MESKATITLKQDGTVEIMCATKEDEVVIRNWLKKKKENPRREPSERERYDLFAAHALTGVLATSNLHTIDRDPGVHASIANDIAIRMVRIRP